MSSDNFQITDNPLRTGYSQACAELLGSIQQLLNRHADHTEQDRMARRALRLAANHAGIGEELLHQLANLSDARLGAVTRSTALAEVWRQSEPRLRPQPEDPTERGEAAARDVTGWLDQLMPPWDDDHQVVMHGTVFKGPRTAGTSVDYQCYPHPYSMGIPLGALLTALKVVAAQGGRGAETIRSVLLEHGVPDTASSRARENAALIENGAHGGPHSGQ